MFVSVLESIEEEIKPIFADLNWAVAPSALKSPLKLLSDKTKMAKEMFSQYETNKIKIQKQCEEIGKKSLFDSQIYGPHEYEDFIQIQVNQVPAAFPTMFLSTVSSSMIKCYITSLKAAASLIGANRTNKIRMILKLYLNLGDHQMCFVPNFKELCLSIEKIINDMEKALASLMMFEENLTGDIDAKNYFLENVKNTKDIQTLKQEIDYGLYLLYEAEKNYKSEWEPYDCLWETSKVDLLKGYKEKGWNAYDFEADINRFLEIGEKVLQIPRYKALEFCIVDCLHLKDSAVARSKEWKNELGSILREITCSNLQNAFDLFETTTSVFEENPKNLKELKEGIIFLINMKKYSKEIQSTFKSIQLNFVVLKRIGIPISEKALHQRHFLAYHDELENQTNILEGDLHKEGPFELKYTYSDALNLISLYHHKLHQLQEKETLMKRNSVFFHIKLKPLVTLISIEKDLEYLTLSWSFVKLLNDYIEEWGSTPIVAFDVKKKMELSNGLRDNIRSLLQKVKRTQWILLEELLGKLHNLDQYFEMILDFQEPALQERHWNALQDLLRITCENSEEFFKSDQFTFAFLSNLTIENLPEQVNKIAVQARKEYEIEQAIKEIEKTWETVCFKMSYYEKFYRVEDSESIVSLIERHQISLGIMKASKYVTHFATKVNSLEDSLLLILDVIKQADYFQSKFYLLENIFAEQAVQAQLPKEASEVQEVTILWKEISLMMNKEKLVWSICHKQGFLEQIIGMNRKVEKVQQSLEFYLDSKRRAFPRFYFISNDDLLCIIGQNSSEDIQPFLKKCFDSINKIKIVEKVEEKLRERIVTTMATGMYSEFDEFFEFKSSVVLYGPVESWLLDIEEMMQITLSSALPKCLQALTNIISKEEFNISNCKWLTNWPAQICILSILISWTAETTNSIKVVQETAVAAVLKNLRKRWRDILNQSVLRVQNESDPLTQRKAMTVIVTLVHSCDIIDSLIGYICNDPSSFEWLVHLRYYIEEERHTCIIKQSKAVFKYGFEYLGNRNRLVITPLTDRCFLSFTTALHLNQGATLKGCRSSGKTETLKDLAVNLGKYVLVINCSESLDQRSSARMLTGLAQIGAWGLFENFNCIREEIVSMLSQEINCILKALAEKRKTFSFVGSDVPLHEGCGMFLSENPDFPSQTCAYFSSFRPVTIISPDVSTIIQIYVFAYGFKDVKALATDIKLVFSMAKDQLSRYCHYDFGLRTITNFLMYIGKQKRLFPKSSDLEIVVSTLRSITLPKLHSSDIRIFESILETVFSSTKGINADVSKFAEEIKKTLLKKSLQPETAIVTKINQLYEIKDYDHAIILLGEAGSGKTTSWQTLKETCTDLHEVKPEEYPSINVHEQMSLSGGQSEARPPVFKSPSKLDTHLSTHCIRDERLSRPCPARE
ncbi:dynein heavy chain 2, axonemal [Trichonephila clavipes]|nr:dynein heavy chain 2, axonemal [Trichonephila clavipes]